MTEGAKRSYRYERKFLVNGMNHHQAIALIKRHPYLFHQPYPPRYINNFYLDSAEMDNYYDNVSGAGSRRKVRLRWYGNLFGEIRQSTLEIKIKQGPVGTKRLYPFSGFTLVKGYNAQALQSLAREIELPPEVKRMVLAQQIVLLNSYYRYYFATRDNRFRLTVDTDLCFYRVARFRNQFAHCQSDYRNIIVELKYDKENDLEAHRVSSYFPFRVTKSSKYVQGIDRVWF
ncbi:MAG: VTC domain-containing protein [Anaerolineales bacterium]|jgi:SPX domain protein involved in polyphosphate accumulation